MADITPSRKAWAFWSALVIALILFLPFILYDRGFFIYYGDFNVQQIPFYKLAHEAVRSGDVLWSWYTDLGANFIGSYSFYLLFSPFFWLTLPFPTSFVPHLMAPLLILKFACASLTACMYLERFVRERAWAVIGGLLYAFSGWMLFDVFFNHFLEVAVFFPLLLLGVEKLVCEDKRVFFALTVALNAMVNYWFFAGEAVFVVLYVLVRMRDRDWGMTPRKFLRLALESVLGLALVSFALVPSVLALMGNPRTRADNILTGWNFWLYWHEQRQPAILQSLFFPPELPARPNFFPDHDAKWASLSGWLPVLGLTGVVGYFLARKTDWVKRLLTICFIFAMIPGLNSLFILLNHSYYARWFYMPVLVMALASIRALEDVRTDASAYECALRWCALVTGVFVVISGLTPNQKDGEWVLGMMAYPDLFWAYAIFAGAALLLCWGVVLGLRRHERFLRYCGGAVALFTVTFGIFYLANGKNNSEQSGFVINTAIRGRDYISLPEEPFARADVFEGMDNIAMFWHIPNIQAFHSIVPPSVMEFYPAMGVKRDVGSRPESDSWALRPLLSVRWLFIQLGKEEQEPMPGYRKYAEQAGFNVYENEYYLPMGFGYTRFISPEQLETVAQKYRPNLLLRAVVLSEKDAEKHADILTRLDVEGPLNFDEEATARDVQDRREQAAYSFTRDRRGFTSSTRLEEETFLFYSVPWEGGWSVTVDNRPAEIVKANVGFMAVRVPAGEHVVRFDYFTPGLREGALMSGGALALLTGYILLSRRGRRAATNGDEARPDASGAGETHLSRDEYLREYGARAERRSRLQRALNEATLLRLRESIGEDEKTLHFVIDEEPPHSGESAGNNIWKEGSSPDSQN